MRWVYGYVFWFFRVRGDHEGKRLFLHGPLAGRLDCLASLPTPKQNTQFKGQPIRVPYAFVTEAAAHPPFPRYHCPALIVHGLKDEVRGCGCGCVSFCIGLLGMMMDDSVIGLYVPLVNGMD